MANFRALGGQTMLSNIKTVEGTITGTLAANASTGFNPTAYVTIPSGYTGIGMIGFSTPSG